MDYEYTETTVNTDAAYFVAEFLIGNTSTRNVAEYLRQEYPERTNEEINEYARRVCAAVHTNIRKMIEILH